MKQPDADNEEMMPFPLSHTTCSRGSNGARTPLLLLLVLFWLSPLRAQNAPGILGPAVNTTGWDEYAPYLVVGHGAEDTLFFTSSRPVPGERQRVLQARIFYATRPVAMRNGPITEGWGTAKMLTSADASFAKFTQGATVITPDRIIFAADRDLTADAKGEIGTSAQLDLYEMVRQGDGYSRPLPIAEVNDPNAWDSQPALSPDGRTLYFVSNRRGGKGARDIWFSRLGAGDRWSRPQPVPNINTPGDEFSPFPGPDGKFYFSTNWDYQTGKLGTRKKEIHRADLVVQGGTPTPLNPRNFDDAIASDARQFGIKLPDGFRVNSEEDDEFPYITPDRKAIFLSSGRASANSQQDVYAFALPVSRIRLQVRVMEQLQDSSGDSLGPVQAVNYPVDVIDTAGGIPAPKGEGGIWLLEPDRTYAVNLGGISVNDCFDIQVYNSQQQNVRTVLPFGGDTLLTREFMVTRRRIAVPQVVFQATETLPYFITGYWWPNTVENLKMFDSRSSSGFFEHSGFLNRQDYNYDSIATIISSSFEERLYKPLDRVLPRFTAKCADTLALVVTVHGYTDPRRLRPEHVYPDQTVTIGTDVNGLPTTIVTGSDMTQADWKVDPNNPNSPTVHLKNNGEQGNIILSKLRAYYTFRTLDTIMKKRSPIYARLAREGRVVLDAEGFGKYRDDGPDDDPQSRRIEIYLDAVPMSQVAEFKREQGGKVRGADLARRKRVTRDTMAASLRPKEKHREGTGDTAVAPASVIPAMDTSSDTLALHPAKDPAAVSCYTIQYCSVQDEGLAHSRARILMEHGVEDARVVPFAQKDGATLYRVRSGCYDNVNEAIRALGGYSWATKALDLGARPVVVR